jgi:FkbM family methyltransferase
MSEFKQIWRQTSTRLTNKLWTLLFYSANNRRMALRRLFDRHMAPNALAFVAFEDHAFFVDPRDQMIAFRLLSGESWQRQEFETALAATQAVGALQLGKWFVDVGANIGTQTVYAMRSGKFCGVIAVEPEPHNLELLRRNLAYNGLSDKVHVVAAAASSSNANATLVRDRQNFGAHSIVPNWSDTPGTSVTVATRTIDDTRKSLNIAAADVGLVWIDVEGHEIEALRGMQSLRAAKVPIVSEVSTLNQSPAKVEVLRKLLAEDYTTAQHLHSLETDGGGPGNHSSTATHHIGDFEFGSRQTDVLIFNSNSVMPLAAE